MKAAYIEAFEKQGHLKIGEFPKPDPKDHEICVAVAFAGVNPADAKIAEGLFQKRVPHQFPLILGWEATGIVHEVGKKVTTFKKGDKVYTYCRKPRLQWGTWAEYVTFPADHGALAPYNLSLAQSASIPIAGLTAWQALFDKAELSEGETVLIHGGGGGVGSLAIQWAKLHKALVITTASSPKANYVLSLGADKVIDYKTHSFVEEIQKAYPSGIDVVFDTIGGSVYKESFSTLKPGGRIVSILEQPDFTLSEKHKVRTEYLFVEPNGKQLQHITYLFEKELVKPPLIQQIPFDQADKALEEVRQGHTQGKIILQIN